MRVYLVRHGQTVSNLENRFCGRTDVALTDEGRAQALRLRPLLEGRIFEAVYSSPQSRAVETTRILLDGDEPFYEEDLREHDFGCFENLTYHEIGERFPADAAAWAKDWNTFHFPGGESARDVFERAVRFTKKITDRHTGDVLVVAHMGLLCSLVAALLGFKAEDIWRFRIENASLSRVVIGEDGYAYLDLLNSAPSAGV